MRRFKQQFRFFPAAVVALGLAAAGVAGAPATAKSIDGDSRSGSAKSRPPMEQADFRLNYAGGDSIDAIVTAPVESLKIENLKARSRRLKRAVKSVQAATMVRAFKTESPARELIQARRRLDQDYERAEREVFKRLEELVGSGDALFDPDLGGLVSRQMELADDLRLLRDTSEWSVLVGRESPRNSRSFMEVLKLLARQLSESTRRS